MARKKRDFDYMELYNPDYKAMKANMFDGISGSSHLYTQATADEPVMTNPFGQEAAYNGTYKMDKLSSNDFDYRNMTPEAQQQFDAYNQQVKDNNKLYRQNQRAYRQEQRQLDGSKTGGALANAIPAAANAMITAFQDKNANTATKVATALGAPELGKIWSADWDEGNKQLDFVKNKINDATNKLIQDSNDTQGAFSAIKNNNQLNLIDASPSKQLSWKDFRGNLFKKGAVATLQGAASGSVGGPWGALGGATVGTLGALFGGIGAKKRAKRAYEEYKDKLNYLQTYASNFNSLQRLNRQQSNENLLNNGLRQQRIQDLANINAYGGNLFEYGGETPPPYYPESQDPTAVQWLSDWYNQRPEQLKNTFYGSTYEMPNPNISGEYEDLNEIPQERILSPTNHMFGDDLYKNLIDRAATASTVYRMDMPSNTLGEYSPAGRDILTENGPVDKPNAAHTISFNMRDVPAFANPEEEYYDEETLPLRVHEYNHPITHGFESLADIINSKAKRKDGVKYDKYYDNPYEIHSYMMEFRQRAGLDPTEKVTKDVLDKHRTELKKSNLDRFTDDSLIDMLNNVVDNNTNNYNNIAAMGGQFDYNLSPNMIDLQNQSLANQKYKYMNQMQPVGFMGGPGDKEPNPGFPRLACGGKLHLNKFDFGGVVNQIDPPPLSEADKRRIDFYERGYGYHNKLDGDDWWKQAASIYDGDSARIANLYENRSKLTPDQQAALFDRLTVRTPKIMEEGYDALQDKDGNWLVPNSFDFGGSMNGMDIPTGMQSYENGGTHEENPNGGIQVGVDNQGTPNLVEEGEFRWGDYVFSNRIDVDLDVLSDFNVPATKKQGKKANKGKLSYADLAKKMAKKAGDLNDPITKDTLNENMKRASQAQDFQKAQMNSDNQLADYKNALKNQTQGNPMYGSMKYNGMGNVNQGLNEGSSAMEGVDNSSLSNVNRSGNEMMAAYGGNLYPDGGNIITSNTGVEFRKQPDGTWMSANGDTWSDAEMQQFVDSGEATMRPIHPAWGVANDIVNRMNTPSYGGSNSFETTPLYATPYFQLNPLGGLAGSGLATDTPLRDLGMQKTYPVIGNGEETGDIYMTPTGIRTSEQVLNQPTNADYTPLTWNSRASNTMNPLYNIDVNLGFGQTQNGALGNGNIYNQQFGLGIRPDYVASKNPNSTVEAVSTYGKNVNGQIQYDPNGNPVMLYPNTYKGLDGKRQTFNSTFGNPVADVYTNPVNVDNKGFYKFGNTQNNTSPTNGSSYSSTSSYSKTVSRNQGANENMPEIPPAESTQEGLPNSKDQAGIVDNRNLDEKHAQFATATTPTVPTLNTAGLYAQLGKGALKNIYNWAGLANTEFKPNYKPEQDLRALGKTGYVPRTADHSGMYRAADLYDINLANNAAQAQAAATARAMRNVNDRNQGAANQLAADYNAMLGIGNNYQTMFDTNMKSRLATDEYNKQTEQTNVQANNDMYKDNQSAGIQAKNFELNANTEANKMQWIKDEYADTQNRIAALNKQSDAARMADNQINFLVDKAKENAYYNLKNKDPRQMYWNDPSTGEWHFKGDNGYYNNLRRAMSGKINSLDTTSNEELAAIADQKGWNNITEEDMKDIIDRQAEREKKISDDKKAKDAQDLRNAKNQYMSRLLDIQRFDPEYKPDYSSYATTDDWLTGYNRLNTDYLRNEDYWKNMQLYDKQIELAKLQAKAYGGKIKTNKRNKNHSYDYMAI